VKKIRDTSKAATARNLSAKRSIVNASKLELFVLIYADVKDAKIMRCASLAPSSKCSRYKKNQKLQLIILL
jgi:hypothetical protein